VRVGQPLNWGSIPGRCRNVSSPPRPDWHRCHATSCPADRGASKRPWRYSNCQSPCTAAVKYVDCTSTRHTWCEKAVCAYRKTFVCGDAWPERWKQRESILDNLKTIHYRSVKHSQILLKSH